MLVQLRYFIVPSLLLLISVSSVLLISEAALAKEYYSPIIKENKLVKMKARCRINPDVIERHSCYGTVSLTNNADRSRMHKVKGFSFPHAQTVGPKRIPIFLERPKQLFDMRIFGEEKRKFHFVTHRKKGIKVALFTRVKPAR